jgi:hypothetical protein
MVVASGLILENPLFSVGLSVRFFWTFDRSVAIKKIVAVSKGMESC